MISFTVATIHQSFTPDRAILRYSAVWAKRKNAENQVISAFCGILPSLIVTPERTINMNKDELS